jgi:hypothetical protein
MSSSEICYPGVEIDSNSLLYFIGVILFKLFVSKFLDP